MNDSLTQKKNHRLDESIVSVVKRLIGEETDASSAAFAQMKAF